MSSLNRIGFIAACFILMGTPCLAQLGLPKIPFKIGGSSGPARDAEKGVNIFNNALNVTDALVGISLEEELKIGESVSIEIIARYEGLLRDTNALRRVNLIGKSLARYGDRPHLDYRFAILNSANVNAFSAPGGFIFITKGLYDVAETDDQLAGILAHEIGHITERHALRIISRNKFVTAGTKIVTETQKDLRVFSTGIESLSKAILEKGFDPQTEYGADAEARKLAAVTGYSKDGLKEVLRKLEQQGNRSTKIFSTHPPLKSRIERMQ